MDPALKKRIQTLGNERRAHIESLVRDPHGIAWCVRHTEIADEVLLAVYAHTVESRPSAPPFAVIATGGYGRRELAPHSDIDLTVVPSDEASPELDGAIRQLFQDLHEAFVSILKMEVGYAYRLISDAPGLDGKTQTGLMDMRLVAGAYAVYEALDRALLDSFSVGEFILAKIEERTEMFAKHHDTPLVAEPNLKEGAGGVRCFHCANWLQASIGERPARPTSAYDYLLMMRNLLHRRAGRHQDSLTRSRQVEIAEDLEVDPIDMMARVVQAGVELHAGYRRSTEKLWETRFSLSKGVLAVQGEARVIGSVDAGEAAVGIAFATRLGLRISDLPIAPPASLHGPAAVFALSRGEPTLRSLDRCGLLEAMLPELTQCRTLVPGDPVHVFTVFEHTLRLIRHLDSLEQGSFPGDVKASLTDIEPLYIAALLHDVGKIDPDKDHSVYGAEIARDVCERWAVDSSVSETIQWLIREHLTMARFIRIRDIQNQNTVEEFAGLVRDPTRLAMLTLLTWADVSAVADNAWTPAQDVFLKELYFRVSMRLEHDAPMPSDPVQSRQRLLRSLKSKPEDSARLHEFVDSLPLHYLTSTPPDLVRVHFELAERAIRGTPTVELFQRHDIGATEITVCAADAAALLSKLLGVLYAFDLSVAGIRASTTTTSPPIALDVFTVSFGQKPVPNATGQVVSAAILEVLRGEKTVEEILIARGKDPSRTQQLFTHGFVPGNPGVLEVRAPRGRGMPYRLSRLIADQGWNVVSARVGQWAGSAAAAFYLVGADGSPLVPEEVDRALNNR
jgi:[protein-PII] uridylyltransferase